ncbi:MAG: ATP-dependent helicase [Bifidobacteriaceae bacterium]|nr:ATP-dependent helicase [Bifidobacteriaceae bacterium]
MIEFLAAPHSPAHVARTLGLPPPTDEQIAIIAAPLSPTLVVAGAGSGKTETMAGRVVYLVANGLIRPDQILGLTFTRKAAAELSDRIRIRLRKLRAAGLSAEPAGATSSAALSPGLGQPTISTYNAYAASVVRDHALRLGIDPEARLLTEGARWQLVQTLVAQWPDDLDTEAAPSTIVGATVHLADQLAEHGIDPADAATRMRAMAKTIGATPPAGRSKAPNAQIRSLVASLITRAQIMGIVSAYGAAKAASSLLDYADQVAIAARVVDADPSVGQAERARFAAVLLDEYQDTSPGQERLLSAMFGEAHPVMAVGDPRQSIYGWRGASASAMARFGDRFPTADGAPTPVLTLSVAWRNDRAILDAAGAIADPLGDPIHVAGDVAHLRPRPGAELGRIDYLYCDTAQDEARKIARYLADHWRDAPGAPTAAVLSRKRSQFAAIVEALREAGIAHEVVGLGGLLALPEIQDIIAVLTVAHDPSRADLLMRLLTSPRMRLGIADLDVLAAWSRRLAADAAGVKSRGGRENPASLPDATEERSLVEALASPPPAEFARPGGRMLTPAARQRIAHLAGILQELRALAYLPLPELVLAAERRLGLDIDLMARGGAVARANVEAFVSATHTFAAESESASLGSFLEWLEFAAAQEHGLDQAPQAPSSQVVQIVTVHGAKGLEWDIVVVPGLSAGTFPATSITSDGVPTASAWLTDLGELPWPLRADAEDLPEFAYVADSLPELNHAYADFRVRAGEHDLAEERRLAYVAITRAKSTLALTGAWRRIGTTAHPPSIFLAELVALGHGDGPPLPTLPPEVEPSSPSGTATSGAAGDQVMWPVANPLGARRADLEGAAARVRAAMAAAPPASAGFDASFGSMGASPDAQLARLLLAEQAEGGRAPGVRLPERLSPSDIMRRAKDQAAFDRDLRRPVPRKPVKASRTGTLFHEWVEGFFAAPAALGDEEEFVDVEDAEVQATIGDLRAAFARSVWARPDNGLRLWRTELAFSMPLGGGTTPGRIDAVFVDAEGGYVIVDWKTGCPPATSTDRRVAGLQLRIYRRALAALASADPARIRAAFHYVSLTRTDSPDDPSIVWLDVPATKEDYDELHRLAGTTA